MVTRLIYGSWVDDYIERATSETIPHGQEDYGTSLEICDQIRSNQMPAKDAAKALRRRIAHKNPNVQVLALKLTDMAVKNGGPVFIREVASREFMEDLMSLTRAPQPLHYEVQRLLLGLIQQWALAFRARPEYGYVDQIYHRLKAEGYPFPPPEAQSNAIVETATAPEWTDSDVCMRCRTPFTLTNRKHHCRNCGQTFCQQCSSNNLPLPHFGMNEPVRVCHGCYLKLKRVTFSPTISTTTTATKSPPKGRPATITAAEPLSTDDGDADLRLAIQLSLQEAQNNSRGYVPPISPKSKAAPQQSVHANSRPKAVEAFGTPQPRLINEPSGPAKVVSQHDSQELLEEDPDLAAAIAASLQEMKVDETRRKARTSYYSDMPSSAVNSSFLSGQALGHTQDESVVPRKPHELSALEAENIELFATLLSRIQSDAQTQGRVPNVYQHPQLPYLYGQITRLQPKLTRHLADVVLTHEQLLSLHGKITQAVKKYDAVLDQRISQAQGSYPVYAPPGPSTYPSAAVTAAPPVATTPYYAPSPGQVPKYVPPTAGYPEGAVQAPYGVYGANVSPPPHLAATATMTPGPGNVPPSSVPTAGGPSGYPPPAQSPAPANPTIYPTHYQPPPQQLPPPAGSYAQPDGTQAPVTAPGYGSLSHPPLQPTPAHQHQPAQTSAPTNTTTTKAEVVEAPLIEL